MTRAFDRSLLQAALLANLAGANMLVNGFHAVSQENGATARTVANAVYGTDQHQILQAGSWAGTVQQVQSPFPSQPDIANGLKLAITTAEATLAAGDYIAVQQPLEGTNLARLLYGTANARAVTLVFMLRPSIALTGYLSLGVANSAVSAIIRSYAVRFTAPANTDTFVAMTIPGDVVQSLNVTSIQSLAVRWCFGAGTTFQVSAGSWQSGNFLAGADVTNLAATVGNNVIISGAVMVPGRVTITQDQLPLLQRRYDDELRLCQRYFCRQYGSVQAYASSANVYLDTPIYLPVSMRVVPSTSFISGASRANLNSVLCSPVDTQYARFAAVSAAAGNAFAVNDFWSFSARM